MRIAAVLNRDSGALRTMDFDAFCAQAEAVFAGEGHDLKCLGASGEGIDQALRQVAADPDVEAIIAAGGDGTISSAAGIAHESGKILGVLPAGTMNLFARALGIPADLQRALHVLARGNVGRVDLALANDRLFVHQFGVGIHARLVRIRNGMSYGSRAGKMLASLRAIAAAAVNPPHFEVVFEDENGPQGRLVSGIAISNNPLGDAPVPVAQSLDSARLGVYFASSLSTRDLIGLAVDVLLSRWRDNPQVTVLETDRITLHFPKRKRGAQAVIDGELIDLARDVELKILPLALSVLLPVAETGAGTDI